MVGQLIVRLEGPCSRGSPRVGQARQRLSHSDGVFPFWISTIIVIILLAYAWATLRQIEASLVRAAGERSERIASQLAAMFADNLRRGRDDVRQVAGRPEVRAFLEQPDDGRRRQAVEAVLKLPPTGTARRIELWTESTRVYQVARDGPPNASGAPAVLPEGTRPTTALALSPLQTRDGIIYSDIVEEVRTDSTPGATRLGFLLVRGAVAINQPGVLANLVGPAASVFLGNKAGGVWTDFSGVVAQPPVNTTRTGSASYRAADGVERLGSLVGVGDTPLAVWVEFPRPAIVAPARALFVRMIVIGVLVALAGALLVRAVTRRITKPLAALTDAAEAISTGDYARRLPSSQRRDEIGRLGDAFNLMASKIQATLEGLETRIGERTEALDALRMSEAALAESEHAFRSTFDHAPLGIAQVSTDGCWLRVNRYLASLLGYQSEELLGRPFSEIFAAPNQAAAPLFDADSAREVRIRRKDGQFVWVRLTVSTLRDSTRGGHHAIVIMEDISERRRLEERLRQSEKMEAIGQLAGGVAHDFNNMLTAILGYGQMLVDTLSPDDPRKSDAEEIVRAADRSAALTAQLLAFSRKQVLQPAVLDLNELVLDACLLLRRLIGEHITFVTQLARDLDRVCADATQLEQIIVNLAVNARDAMPGGGQLTIETGNAELGEGSTIGDTIAVAPGRYVMISVSDSGMGMDAETRRRLFEPFFTTKEQGRGTGLGLATVYGIVKQSGGYIWVYSEPGQGATFRIYLPAATESAVASPGRPPASSQTGSETILLVEDERAVRGLTKVILERSGYHVLDAATPEEAREIFRAHGHTIDLVMTDVVMPGSHGPALYRDLSADRDSLKVLYMSGYPDQEILEAGRLEPGVHFIEKPFTAQKLTQKIREILNV